MKIGDLQLGQPTVLAPMAALTCGVFRRLVDWIGGCGLLVTEMVSVEALRRGNRRTILMIDPFVGKTPQFVQLFGASPEAFVEATQTLERVDIAGIDINMGCPVPKVSRNGAGAALLADPVRMAAIIGAVRKHTRRPLTVKIRLGVDRVDVAALARVVEESGADAIAVHFRLKTDPWTGPARWEFAPVVKAAVKIPVIGNGNIDTVSDARLRLAEVDGIMSGRGAVANPFLFREIAGQETTPADWRAMAVRLAELIEEFTPERNRAGKLKAFSRYLTTGGRCSRAEKKALFTAQTFAEARDRFLAVFPPGN